jgi:hypothetical protein
MLKRILKKNHQLGMKKNSIQPKPKIKNQLSLESLMKEIRTIEIYYDDLENIDNLKLLEKSKTDLETHIEHLKVCLTSINERVNELNF